MPEITFTGSAKKAGVNSFVYQNVKIETMFSHVRAVMDTASTLIAYQET
jgi:hypothetical protein